MQCAAKLVRWYEKGQWWNGESFSERMKFAKENGLTFKLLPERAESRTLLRIAAPNLARVDSDMSYYEAQLEEDRYNEAVQLKGISVDFLSQYMPHRLAKEVHNPVNNQYSALEDDNVVCS